MKIYKMVLLFFTFNSVFAAELLKKDDYALSFAKGEVQSVSSLCPKRPYTYCVTDGTSINLALKLNGCFDRIGPVAYKLKENDDNTLDIFLSAVNLHNKKSMLSDCLKTPVVNYNISLIMKFYAKEDIRVHFLTGANK